MLKNIKTQFMKQSVDISPNQKLSKFNLLYDEVFQQVKKKIPTQLQNFPLIKMKSYQEPTNRRYSEVQQQNCFLQHHHSINILTSRQQILNQTKNKRSNSCYDKKSVNKVLWQKKMSFQTLRISSSSNKFKNPQFSRQLHRQSLKFLRQKTSQEKLLNQNEDYNISSHFSILPLNLTSSKQEKQKFLANKKNIQDRFKITFVNNKQKKASKINFLGKKERNPFWETKRDENQFVNFVRDKVNSNF